MHFVSTSLETKCVNMEIFEFEPHEMCTCPHKFRLNHMSAFVV